MAMVRESSSDNNNNNNDDDDDSAEAAAAAALLKLSDYHPVVIEGMGWYDPRDPNEVASAIVRGLEQKKISSNNKPLLVITQGDPLAPRGISAITPLVAQKISKSERGLVCLDESIDSSHSRDADRTNVVVEVRYSQLLQVLQQSNTTTTATTTILQDLENSIDEHIVHQNQMRSKSNKPPVKDYFKTYAMLQEVTKGGLKELCGGSITIAHTSTEINPCSVTSFYRVGLKLGLYDSTDLLEYDNNNNNNKTATETLDFETIDPR